MMPYPPSLNQNPLLPLARTLGAVPDALRHLPPSIGVESELMDVTRATDGRWVGRITGKKRIACARWGYSVEISGAPSHEGRRYRWLPGAWSALFTRCARAGSAGGNPMCALRSVLDHPRSAARQPPRHGAAWLTVPSRTCTRTGTLILSLSDGIRLFKTGSDYFQEDWHELYRNGQRIGKTSFQNGSWKWRRADQNTGHRDAPGCGEAAVALLYSVADSAHMRAVITSHAPAIIAAPARPCWTEDPDPPAVWPDTPAPPSITTLADAMLALRPDGVACSWVLGLRLGCAHRVRLRIETDGQVCVSDDGAYQAGSANYPLWGCSF